MADPSLNDNPTACPHCASSQAGLLCVCPAGKSPVLVVEMSQTSSIGSTEFFASQERKKERNTSRESSLKDLVNIENSATQIDSLFSIPISKSLLIL
jgi:serine/threonine kinase 33